MCRMFLTFLVFCSVANMYSSQSAVKKRKLSSEKQIDHLIKEVIFGKRRAIDMADSLLINKKSSLGNTLLVAAANRKRLLFVKILMKKGASVNGTCRDGSTPLIQAAWKGYVAIVQVLLSSIHILVDTKDDAGFTALHYAAMEGHTQVVEALVAAGANVNVLTPHGHTAIDLAKHYGHAQVVEFLAGGSCTKSIVETQGV